MLESSVSQAEIQEMRSLIKRMKYRFLRLQPSDGSEEEPDYSPLAHPGDYVAPSAAEVGKGRCLAILRQLKLSVCAGYHLLPESVQVEVATSLESYLFELLREVEVFSDREARTEYLATKQRRAARLKGDA